MDHQPGVPGIERVRLLHGHVDADTAYLVPDYPYGRTLRCRIRFWIDTATRAGTKFGWQRFVSQTTNPRRPGHPWNTPKAATYSPRVWMYLDSNQHVQHTAISGYGIEPHVDARLRLSGIFAQMTDTDRTIYQQLLAVSRRFPNHWQRWEDTVAFLTEQLSTHGQVPAADNGFVSRDGQPYYIGTDAYPIAVAVARQRLTDPPPRALPDSP